MNYISKFKSLLKQPPLGKMTVSEAVIKVVAESQQSLSSDLVLACTKTSTKLYQNLHHIAPSISHRIPKKKVKREENLLRLWATQRHEKIWRCGIMYKARPYPHSTKWFACEANDDRLPPNITEVQSDWIARVWRAHLTIRHFTNWNDGREDIWFVRIWFEKGPNFICTSISMFGMLAEGSSIAGCCAVYMGLNTFMCVCVCVCVLRMLIVECIGDEDHCI